MQIEIARADLLPALSIVTGVVERRQTLPILGNVLLVAKDGMLSATTTDLEIQVNTQTPCNVADDGEVTLPARKTVDICRALPEGASVKIRTDGERATINSGRSRFVLSTLPAGDFPTIEESDAGSSVTLEQGVLRRLLEKASIAMAQQDVRYYLNGVLLELTEGRVVAVATDGHRLAKVEQGVAGAEGFEERLQVIIPAKTVMELKRLLETSGHEVRVELSQRSLRAEIGDTKVTSKLVDGRYPDYERVIPKDLSRCAIIDRDLLRGALQRAAILSNEKYKGVRVTFEPGALRLQSQNPEKEEAEDEIGIEFSGEATTFGFNVAYILDVLNALDGDRVEVTFNDSSSSAIWRNEGVDSETFVIMPMRL